MFPFAVESTKLQTCKENRRMHGDFQEFCEGQGLLIVIPDPCAYSITDPEYQSSCVFLFFAGIPRNCPGLLCIPGEGAVSLALLH